MKKIYVSCIPSTLNYGSAMMAINLIHYCRVSMGDNIEFYTDCKTEEDVKRLIESTGYNKIYKTEYETDLYRKYESKVEKGLNYALKMKHISKQISKKYDLYIHLGGDDLSEGYSKFYPILALRRNMLISRMMPTMLVGQTIGPFTGIREKMTEKCLMNSKVYTRDPNSYEYLKNFNKIDHLQSSADLAFLDLPRQCDAVYEAKTLSKFGLTKEKYITIVPSGLVNSYTSNPERYYENWVKIVKNTLGHSLLEGEDSKLVLLAHVLKKGVDDRKAIQKVISKLNPDEREKIIVVNDEIQPVEARFILGNGITTITGRMHAAVSTMQMGTPAIPISYSPKYAGVIGRTMKMNECIVETMNTDHWEKMLVPSLVAEKLEYVAQNHIDISSVLSKQVEMCKLSVSEMIEEISQSI